MARVRSSIRVRAKKCMAGWGGLVGKLITDDTDGTDKKFEQEVAKETEKIFEHRAYFAPFACICSKWIFGFRSPFFPFKRLRIAAFMPSMVVLGLLKRALGGREKSLLSPRAVSFKYWVLL